MFNNSNVTNYFDGLLFSILVSVCCLKSLFSPSLLEMAWFHHALQTSSNQPEASMMPHTLESQRHISNLTTQFGMSNTQGWPTHPPVSITDFPAASGCIVPQRLEDLSCTSLNMGSREDPLLLSYVTLQEQRCVLSWFLAWSADQRERFLEDLISKAVPGKVSSLLDQLNTLQVICLVCLCFVTVKWCLNINLDEYF